MAGEKFNLVFSGKVAPGFELEQAKKNMQALFRIDEAKVEALFSGKSIVLKKNLDAEAANRYRTAMRKAGAVAFMVPLKDDVPVTPPPESAPSPQEEQPIGSTVDASQRDVESEPQLTTVLGAQPAAPYEPRKPIEAPEFDLAEVGADLLSDGEKAVTEMVEVDTSGISVQESGGNLVSADEISRPAAIEVVIPEVDIAPAGSDVLKPEERAKAPAVDVDTSKMSLAEPGGRLSEPKDAPPAAPNVDHIQLEK